MDPVAPALRAPAVDAARRMFALPVERRCAFHQPEWGGMAGYQFGDPNELYVGEEPTSEYWHVVRERPGGLGNRWPLPDVEGPLMAWMDARERFGLAVLDGLSEALGEPGALRRWTDGGYAMLRLICYPPGPEVVPHTALRASEHVDAGLLSLYDGGTSPGLQLFMDGEWREVPTGRAVVAAGEVMTTASGGRIPGALHRVVYPEPSAEERWSLPFFLNPRLDQPMYALGQAPRGGSDGRSYGELLRERTGWGPVGVIDGRSGQ